MLHNLFLLLQNGDVFGGIHSDFGGVVLIGLEKIKSAAGSLETTSMMLSGLRVVTLLSVEGVGDPVIMYQNYSVTVVPLTTQDIYRESNRLPCKTAVCL